ncbi:palmitoyl-protein thioesterase 1-like [Leguminivora glycinivorella]|uniref:palmitoyl-protein thioesterase 1-like n=1 Tax=Leguminivora glycinivorella TaxID=1035111 RepID=UPI00200C3154|nr:palmitoyl-protein thioesterase 1-like [Leguminivora glycinivorella]
MKLFVSLLCIHIAVALLALRNESALPIVLWHGLGDTCCLPISTGVLRLFLYGKIKNIHVISIDTSSDSIISLQDSYFLNPNQQVDYACVVLREDKNLRNGFNVIGLGQGSLFLRAVIQRCGHKLPPIKNYISFGGPQQGISGLPYCTAVSHQTCSSMRELLEFAPYHYMTQHAILPATYWHDPLRNEDYKKRSTFLSDINNEEVINELYRSNLKQLQRFIMVKFKNESVIQPPESAWFGYYTPGQKKELQTLQQSSIYLEDRLGLQEMDKAGKLIFLTHPNQHLEFDELWLLENIVPYLVDKRNNGTSADVLINIKIDTN